MHFLPISTPKKIAVFFTVVGLVYSPVRQSRSHIQLVLLRGRAAQNVNDDPGEVSLAQRGGMQRHNSEHCAGYPIAAQNNVQEIA